VRSRRWPRIAKNESELIRPDLDLSELGSRWWPFGKWATLRLDPLYCCSGHIPGSGATLAAHESFACTARAQAKVMS
jgi:hypothetical protein